MTAADEDRVFTKEDAGRSIRNEALWLAEDRQEPRTAGSLNPYHRNLLRKIAERDALAPGDPFGSGSVVTSSATSVDPYHVFLHWRTARSLIAGGWLRCIHHGYDEGDYSVLVLTDAGREAAR